GGNGGGGLDGGERFGAPAVHRDRGRALDDWCGPWNIGLPPPREFPTMIRTTSGRSALVLASVLTIGASACTSDRMVGPSTPQAASSAPEENIFTAHAAFQRYVAIGTSISAGVQSDGLTAGGQLASWPN